jgi:hypothetical protein
MYALKALGILEITQYIITCIQVSQFVKMSRLNRHYKLVTSRQLLVSFGYRELLIRFCIHCVVNLRVGNHLDNLQLVRHTS